MEPRACLSCCSRCWMGLGQCSAVSAKSFHCGNPSAASLSGARDAAHQQSAFQGRAKSRSPCTALLHSWLCSCPARGWWHRQCSCCVRDSLGLQPLQLQLPLPFYGSFYSQGHQMPRTETFMLEKLGLGLRLEVYCSWAPSFGNILSAKVLYQKQSPLCRNKPHTWPGSEAEMFPAGHKAMKGPLAVPTPAM